MDSAMTAWVIQQIYKLVEEKKEAAAVIATLVGVTKTRLVEGVSFGFRDVGVEEPYFEWT